MYVSWKDIYVYTVKHNLIYISTKSYFPLPFVINQVVHEISELSGLVLGRRRGLAEWNE